MRPGGSSAKPTDGCRPQQNIPGVEPGYYWEPDAFGLEYEDVRLQTKDGVSLHAWLVWPSSGLMRRRKKDAPVVLFFQVSCSPGLCCIRGCSSWGARHSSCKSRRVGTDAADFAA